MTTCNRDALLKLTSLVRPALSTQSFIPALQHLCFADGRVTAYNDVTAISVKTPLADEERCVPGELFIKALTSFNAESVAIVDGADGHSELLLTSGRSKLKLPCLPVKDFPLPELPKRSEVLSVDDEILDGIRRCLFSVGTDPTHPAQMGVTLDSEDGRAVLYSTDNYSISRAATKSKVTLPGGSPIILPTFFCEQLLVLSKAYPDDDIDLHVFGGALKATFGKNAYLVTKTLVDTEPLDFPKIINKHLRIGDLKKSLSRIPDSFDAAWNRALLVLQSEADKATLVHNAAPGVVDIQSRSALGEADDRLEVDPDLKGFTDFHVDPSLVVRAAKSCGSIAFYERVMVLATDDAAFMHLIAHCSA